ELPPMEHEPATDPVLRPGIVGPAVDGTQNLAHLAIVSPSSAVGFAGGIVSFQNRFQAAGHRVSIDFAPHEPSPNFRDEADHVFPGTDTQRWEALRAGLFDPGTTAVVASS